MPDERETFLSELTLGATMPKVAKPKRTSLSISLPPELGARLVQEADARMLNTSLLVERAVAAYLPTLPPLNGETGA